MNILDFLPKEVSAIHFLDENDWLNERRKGMGGSDVSVVMGLNKYKSELRLYKEKVEGLREDTSENTFIKKGKDLEDLIRLKYCLPYFKDKGYIVIHPDVILTNSVKPVFRANLDGFAVPEMYNGNYADNIVVEIKWVSEYGESNWNGDDYYGVPVNYYAQVQEYMFVTGARKAVVCALFDNNWKVQFYEVPFNPDFVSKMIADTERFMNVHVNCKIPPKINSELDKEFILEELKTSTGVAPYADADMDEKIVLYKELKHNIKTLQDGLNGILSDLTEKYLKGARPQSPLLRMNISKVCSKRFDASSFEKDYPDLHKQYVKESEYTRTTII